MGDRRRGWLVFLVFLCVLGPGTVTGLAAVRDTAVANQGAVVRDAAADQGAVVRNAAAAYQRAVVRGAAAADLDAAEAVRVAAASASDPALDGAEIPGQEKWEDIDRFLRQVQPETGSASFSELVQSLMAGEGKKAGRILLDLFQNLLLQEVRNGGRLAGQLTALCVMGAVFSNFTGIFHSGQVSETGFFLTYLLVAAVLAAAVLEGVEITRAALESQTAFMRVLLPAYLLAITWAGGSMTAAAWMELILLLLSLVPWLYVSLLLPLIRIYTLLVMAGNMGKEDMLSKLAELVQGAVRWGSRTLFGVVIGFQAIQGMVLPYADAVKTSGAQKLLQVIPGVGQGLGAAAKLLIGSGVLIKNSMGAAAIVVLLVLSLTPILKLAVLFLLYKAAASLLQPISDKRLVACIAGVAEGEKLLLGLTVSGMMVFILTIALICMGTNVTYLA